VHGTHTGTGSRLGCFVRGQKRRRKSVSEPWWVGATSVDKSRASEGSTDTAPLHTTLLSTSSEPSPFRTREEPARGRSSLILVLRPWRFRSSSSSSSWPCSPAQVSAPDLPLGASCLLCFGRFVFFIPVLVGLSSCLLRR
jgi:hypothetical protein